MTTMIMIIMWVIESPIMSCAWHESKLQDLVLKFLMKMRMEIVNWQMDAVRFLLLCMCVKDLFLLFIYFYLC